jgi:hypothetical protein
MPMTGIGTRSSDPAGANTRLEALWMDNATEAIADDKAKIVSKAGAREGAKEQANMATTAHTKYCTSTPMDL